MAFHSRDWGAHPGDAWLWGLMCGWDCDEAHDHDEECDRSMAEVAGRHGWSEAEVARLRRLRRALAPR